MDVISNPAEGQGAVRTEGKERSAHYRFTISDGDCHIGSVKIRTLSIHPSGPRIPKPRWSTHHTQIIAMMISFSFPLMLQQRDEL